MKTTLLRRIALLSTITIVMSSGGIAWAQDEPVAPTSPTTDTTVAPADPTSTTEATVPPAETTPSTSTPTEPAALETVPATEEPAPAPEPSTDFIVTFAGGTTAASQLDAIAAAGAVGTDSVPALRLHAISATATAIAALRADARVATVDVDRSRVVEAAPDDASYPNQWSLPRIGWDAARDTVTPLGSAVVAVLDTGVDGSHPDLAGNLVPGTSIIGSGDGTVDINGHGTAMAGIVAAGTNNGIGIAGVGYAGVKVMPVTVLGADGTGQDSDIISGVVYAADNGADVILMSFSAPQYSAALQAAVDYAWNRGAVLVAATGNDGSSAPAFPAGDRGVVGVSSTDTSDALSMSSNYGDAVFLGAPGEGITTLANGGGVTTISGTSAAAAIVAGSVAVLAAADVSASNGVVVGRLARNADAAGTAAQTGNGRVNLGRAIVDTAIDPVKPAGAAPVADGGPFVGPYRAADKTLTITKAGTGTGTVTSSASTKTTQSITCGMTCSASFDNDETVSLTASPTAGSTFAGWSVTAGTPTSNTCIGSATACSLNLNNTAITLSATFNSAPVNQAPLVDLNGAAAGIDALTSFMEDQVPAALASAVQVSDVDNPNMVSATVTLTNRPDGAAETLFVSASSCVGITVTAYNATTGVLTLSGSASKTAYQTCLAAVKYDNTSQNPDPTNRMINFVANDGTSSSSVAKVTLTVTAVNDAPVVDLNGAAVGIDASASFMEDQVPAALAPAVQVSDVDNANMASATVTLTNRPDGAAETLSVSGCAAGITVTVYNASTGVLALSGSASKTAYQTCLAAVKYDNTSQNPDPTNRMINFVANDGTSSSSVAKVTLTVTAVNDAPKAVNDTKTVVEDSSANTVNVLVNDTDADNLAAPFNNGLTVIANTNASNGTVTIAADGLSVSYTPDANFFGTDTFTYTISDNGAVGGTGHTDTATVTVTVTNVNDAPKAVNDTKTVVEDSSANTVNVLVNDTDADNLAAPFNNGLTVIANTNASNGTVTIAADGLSVSYTPDANFFGTDTFTYTISDNGAVGGTGHTDTATVTVTVTNVNDAPKAVNDTKTVVEDSSANTVNVLVNDTDADNLAAPFNNGLTVIANTNASNGTVTIAADGLSVSYTPDANFFGTDTFTYTITDGNGGSDTATVTVTVTNVNDDPNAIADEATVAEDSSGNVIDVLANDNDGVDVGETLTVTAASISNPDNGSASLITTGDDAGKISYTPDANFFGTDTFTYTITDGNGGSDTATVTVTVTNVNDDPNAIADEATVAEDSSGNVIDVLANDNDGVDVGETLTVTAASISNPDNGSASLITTGDDAGKISYTPDANFFGTDTFTYTITDGNGGSDTATVTVTVTNVNDDPNAIADEATVAEDSSGNVIDVLANDNDGVDVGETLTVTAASISNPDNGSASLITTGDDAGKISYTPDANFFGTDTFTYTITDGNGGSDTATVTVTVTNVNDDPNAIADEATVAEDSSGNVIDVLANDNDGVDVGETLTVTAASISNPDNGSASLITTGDDAGKISYTPDANFFGTDTFTYTITDGNGGSDTATVTVTVTNVNDDPNAIADEATVAEDSSGNVIDVLANDNDGVDVGETLTVTAASISNPDNGSASLITTGDDAGKISYTPDANFFGTDTFTYTITDGNGGSDTATVTVTVTNVNDDPNAIADEATVAEDSSGNVIDVLANDNDGVDVGETLTVTAASISNPDNGSASLITTGDDAGKISYTPDANFFGTDTFTYTITDGNGGSDTATVTVTVTNVNDDPNAIADEATVAEDSSGNVIDVLANDNDGVDVGETLTVTAASISNPDNGSASLITTGDDAGKISYTPDANFFGTDTFTYTITDGNGGSDTATVTVTVTNVNDAPTAVNDSRSVAEDGSVVIDPRDNDSTGPANESTQTLTVTAVGTAAHGTATVAADGRSVTYTPATDYNGADSFTYTITDNGTTNGANDFKSHTATVNVTVTEVNDAPRALSATPATQDMQYSDPIANVSISATDIDSAAASLAATTTWKKSTDTDFATTQPLGGLTLAPTGSTSTDPRTWTLSGRAMVAAGTYAVRIHISDGSASSYIEVTIIVTKENATIEYTGDTLKATGSTSTSSTTSLNLSAIVREASDGNLGTQLPGTTVTFSLYKFTDTAMTTPVKTCTATVIAGATAGTGTAACSATSVAADNYIVKVVLNTNPYYSAPVENQAVTVTISGTGFTTGGGWIREPALGSKSNFGFTVKYLKNGGVQGNSVYIYRKTVAANTVANPAGGFLPAGEYNWIIKSNVMAGLTQSCATTTPKVCKATFTGKANITAANRTTGVAYSLGGNYQFQVDVTDNSEPGSSPGAGPDSYAIRVWDTSTGTYYQLGTPSTQVLIDGGNIQVKP